MTKILIIVLAAVSLLSAYAFSPAPAAEEKDLEVFEMEELAKELAASGKNYLPFLNRETLRAGLYQLPAGATDPQQPHELDEVYHILSGKAYFTAGDETISVQQGSVLFVKAKVNHRFHEIEEDLKILVFFSTAEN